MIVVKMTMNIKKMDLLLGIYILMSKAKIYAAHGLVIF